MRDLVELIHAVVAPLSDLGREVEVSFGVDDALTEAIAALPDAEVREAVYLPTDEPPYVIRTARAAIGRVSLRAQCDGRKALPEEIARVGRWSDPKCSSPSGYVR